MKAIEAGRGYLDAYHAAIRKQIQEKESKRRAEEQHHAAAQVGEAVKRGLRITVSVKPGEARAVRPLAEYIRTNGVDE
jgi:ATP-dependent RNA circularization protein (DNA/RNA ligase family)